MTDDLIESAEWLKARNSPGYGPLAIPQSIDDKITELLRTWAGLEPSARSVASSRVLDDQHYTLMAYAERMASSAVRTRDMEKIYFGLLALGVDGWRGDWRESVMILSVLYDAAQRLSATAEPVFERAVALLAPKAATAFASFLRRSPADKSIEAMGYVAASDDDGFRYVRTW
jgi:hypothetical protein